jgi:signal transduction histidine kinase
LERETLLERLRAHRTLAAAPAHQLAWLAERGWLAKFPAGVTLVRTGEPIRDLYVVLSGRFDIRVPRESGPRRVMEWRGGDVAGFLPYSRMRVSPGDIRITEPTEILALAVELFPELIRECHELTAILVHEMLDRARHFRASDLHDEKLASLGRLAAGLAHELNNPASAVARGAELLLARLPATEAAFRALGAERLAPEEMAAFAELCARCLAEGPPPSRSPLDQAEREEALGAWLARRGLGREDAESLAETGLDPAALDTAAAAISGPALGAALAALAASCGTRRLAGEVARAAGRVHELVAAVKGFTYMDAATVPQPVDLARGLRDTLAILGPKARTRGVRLDVEVPPDLPRVDGLGGELNQVWANLVDNAIDASPEGGRVEVGAWREGAEVVIRVANDGPEIPEEVRARLFEPFFTTKPPGEGVGLGLATARSLVGQHEGEIEVDSRPGRTEFRVRLPAGGAGAAGGRGKEGSDAPFPD